MDKKFIKECVLQYDVLASILLAFILLPITLADIMIKGGILK